MITPKPLKIFGVQNACARDCLSNIHLFTISGDDETVDKHIATKLAKKSGLRPYFLSIRSATGDEMLRWL
jgi:hypothetical protein